MEPARREVVSPDGTVIAYSVYEGALPAIVILHGLAGSSREFESTARALNGRKVILVDQRGHGFSTREPADTSREAFVDDIVRVITMEAVDPVDLVGQSLGAHTAMLTAATRPDLVRKLVLLETNEGGGSPKESAALGDFFRSWNVPFHNHAEARAALGDGPLARAWVEDLEEGPGGLYPRFDPDVMEHTSQAMADPRMAEWQRVTAPTLVVYADGGMFTEEHKRRFVDQGRDVVRIDLVGASHDAHLDASEQWTAALVNFVSDRIEARVDTSPDTVDERSREALARFAEAQTPHTPEEQHDAVRRSLGAAPVQAPGRQHPFTWSGVITTDLRGFSVSIHADGEYAPPYATTSSDDFVASTTHGARIFTGMYAGPAHLTLNALASAPASDPGWEQVAELPLDTRFGVIRVEDQAPASVAASLNLATGGPGRYRLRVCVNGRSLAYDEIAADPVERYLLQVWPEANRGQVSDTRGMDRGVAEPNPAAEPESRGATLGTEPVRGPRPVRP